MSAVAMSNHKSRLRCVFNISVHQALISLILMLTLLLELVFGHSNVSREAAELFNFTFHKINPVLLYIVDPFAV